MQFSSLGQTNKPCDIWVFKDADENNNKDV